MLHQEEYNYIKNEDFERRKVGNKQEKLKMFGHELCMCLLNTDHEKQNYVKPV